jgi:phage major head subunit gpT-like protein
MAPLSLRADISPRSINDADRTVELIFTTGAAVRRMDYWTGKDYLEILSLDPAHVRLDRLNDGAPLLDSHSAWSVADQLGAVVPGSAVLMKKAGLVKVRFSKREAVEPVWQDVRDGIIRSVSVGYMPHKYEETAGEGDAIPTRKAIDWEPFEVSMVPIPADAGAKVRGGSADANPCEIVTRAQEEPKPSKEAVPTKESKMNEDRSETIAESVERTAPPATPPPPAEPTERDAGAAAERTRVQGIRNACLAARLPRSFEDKLIADGVALVDAQNRVFDELRKRDANPGTPNPNAGRVEIVGDDPMVHKRRGIENALLHRCFPRQPGPVPGKMVGFELSDEGREYRGLGLMDIAEIYLRGQGVRITGMNKLDRAGAALFTRAGMHTTSDFPYLLADAANKLLREAYAEAPQTWQPLARSVPLADFKASNMLQVGEAPALAEILEHGEFTHGTITEGREQVQLKTYGKIFAITRTALINDDLNAFAQVPAAFGRAARALETTLAWAQITSNPTMGDAHSLFDATYHINYTASGTAISVDSLGVARKALRSQKGLDGVTRLNLMARYLIVPAAKETIADQYVAQITPAEGAKANPFAVGGRTPLAVICEPLLDGTSATAWYMATDVASAPALFYGTLDGQAGPSVDQELGFDIDGLKVRCRLDVAFKAADWRAIYLNAGA